MLVPLRRTQTLSDRGDTDTDSMPCGQHVPDAFKKSRQLRSVPESVPLGGAGCPVLRPLGDGRGHNQQNAVPSHTLLMTSHTPHLSFQNPEVSRLGSILCNHTGFKCWGWDANP